MTIGIWCGISWCWFNNGSSAKIIFWINRSSTFCASGYRRQICSITADTLSLPKSETNRSRTAVPASSAPDEELVSTSDPNSRAHASPPGISMRLLPSCESVWLRVTVTVKSAPIAPLFSLAKMFTEVPEEDAVTASTKARTNNCWVSVRCTTSRMVGISSGNLERASRRKRPIFFSRNSFSVSNSCAVAGAFGPAVKADVAHAAPAPRPPPGRVARNVCTDTPPPALLVYIFTVSCFVRAHQWIFFLGRPGFIGSCCVLV